MKLINDFGLGNLVDIFKFGCRCCPVVILAGLPSGLRRIVDPTMRLHNLLLLFNQLPTAFPGSKTFFLIL